MNGDITPLPYTLLFRAQRQLCFIFGGYSNLGGNKYYFGILIANSVLKLCRLMLVQRIEFGYRRRLTLGVETKLDGDIPRLNQGSSCLVK